MATIVDVNFGGADPAASTGGAALPTLGLVDITDVTGVVFPFPVEIVGILGTANPSSGDTVILTPLVGGAVPTNAPTLTLSHGAAIGTANVNATGIFFGTGQGVKVAANTLIGCQYKTTTGSTYTANDILAKLIVKLPDLI